MLSLCVCLLSLSDHSTIRICEENFVTSRIKLSCSLVRVGLHLAHSLAMSVEHLPAPHHAVHHRRPLLLNRLALLPFDFLLSSFVEESFTLLHSYERYSLWWSYFSDVLSPISVQIFSLAVRGTSCTLWLMGIEARSYARSCPSLLLPLLSRRRGRSSWRYQGRLGLQQR